MWILLTGPSDLGNQYTDKIKSAFLRYFNLAVHTANSILNDPKKSEEIAASVFEKMISSPEKFFDHCKSEDHLKNFIATVARNLAKDVLKHEKIVSINSDEENFFDILENESDEDMDFKILFRDFLLSLPRETRDIFTLKIAYGYKLSEIARLLNKNVKAVQRKWERGLEKMCAYFDACGIDVKNRRNGG
ncbi:sigma-70 family RNA polymerase sigma factor [Clostridium sp. D33t1_170424_F3]|uniref:sigma-70 family RNA polymerase sigma factor n=1 Tax=Clostridium sp. D33t1_170424_F3 TaxID=2787099 RepID=UPI0018AC7829|nr:sigma-70 family RNA polymerase sigma factor [Clostridium sp. D33t1_170424_F3]